MSKHTTSNTPPQITDKATILGIDYGTRQIGLALLHLPMGVATPLDVIRSKNEKPNWQAIESALKEWQPDHALIGLPLNMDGTESEMSARTRRFGRQLEGRFGLANTMVDERLSSAEARERLEDQGGSHYKDRPTDAIAAQLLLEQWLNEHS